VASKPIYRIRFLNEGKVYELYARRVHHGELFGFVQIEDILWGKRSEVIVDPSEQELKNEFSGVKRTSIPLHAIVRIDEVDKGGTAKILPMPAVTESKVSPVTIPLYTPGGRPRKSD
jgi:hypothetical protein